MNQTAYNGVTNFIKGLPLIGGFCKFWFIPIEEVASMPVINPLNQILKDEITLKTGKAWRGPVPVPDDQLGFTENAKTSNSGPSYEIKVGCVYGGDIPAARVNIDNMAYHQYMIVGKLRSTGFYVVIGNPETGADFTGSFDSGNANGNAALNTLTFATEQINKALVLPTFNSRQSGYVDFRSDTNVNADDYWELESSNDSWELESFNDYWQLQ